MTQLFATENEMREYFDESPEMVFKGFKITRDGVLAFYEMATIKPVTSEKKYVVATAYGSSYMYVAKKGTTFCKRDAKMFTKKEAETKALYMSRNGHYNWKLQAS